MPRLSKRNKGDETQTNHAVLFPFNRTYMPQHLTSSPSPENSCVAGASSSLPAHWTATAPQASTSSESSNSRSVLPTHFPLETSQYRNCFPTCCPVNKSPSNPTTSRNDEHDSESDEKSPLLPSSNQQTNVCPDYEPSEVEEWMRRRLCYFFMAPLEKFHAKGRIPYKLFIQILKVIIVTVQLIQFGRDRAAHVSFGKSSYQAFCHLYLRDWDAQYETLDYPPATGSYSVYTRDDFFNYIGFAITQFNETESIALGAYYYESPIPAVQLCMNTLILDDPTSLLPNMEQVRKLCDTIYPLAIDSSNFKDAKAVELFLLSRNLSVDFTLLLGFTIEFNLLSPPITRLDWIHVSECYRFNVTVSMENPSQSGKMDIYLYAPYSVKSCFIDLPQPNLHEPATQLNQPHLKGHLTRQIWQSPPTCSWFSTIYSSTRRILTASLHALVLAMGMVSFVLCLRSLVKGLKLWMETVQFFKHWYAIKLDGVFWEFFRPWMILIMINDVLIISSSLYNLITINQVKEKYEPVSYLMGISELLVLIGVLYYVGFSYDNSLLTRTIVRSIPGLFRFSLCSLILFLAFTLCGWVVLGPYNLKFQSFMSTLECLYSLINGDDMYVTFSIINEHGPYGIYLFSRFFLYIFITLFIYVVLNLFVTIIFEAYEEVKEMQQTHGRPRDSPLWHFISHQKYHSKSSLFRMDDIRPDRHLLEQQACGSTQPLFRIVTTSIVSALRFKRLTDQSKQAGDTDGANHDGDDDDNPTNQKHPSGTSSDPVAGSSSSVSVMSRNQSKSQSPVPTGDKVGEHLSGSISSADQVTASHRCNDDPDV